VDKIFGFERVPSVFIHEIGLDEIDLAIKHRVKSPHFFSCVMDFQSTRNQWILHNQSTDKPRVVGTRQVLLPHVRQRTELDRFVNKHVSGTLEMIPSVFGQREIDTRSLFDLLIGNWDRFNNDFSVLQRTLSVAEFDENLLVYIDNNGLSRETRLEPFKYCRFYHNVVRKIGSIANPQKEIFNRIMTSEPLVKELVNSHTVDVYNDLRPLHDMNKRRLQVLSMIEDCIQTYGFHHVFVAQ
jgi:hypothetical protein